MRLPDDLPKILEHFCISTNRFYINEHELRMQWNYFFIGIHVILANGSDNPYEQLLAACANRDLAETLRLTEETKLADHPYLMHVLRTLLQEGALKEMGNSLLEKLFKAPMLIQKNEMDQETLHALLQAYPAQVESLLEMVMIHRLPIDWKQILEDGKYVPQACLMLKKKRISECYQQEKSLSNLFYYFIVDPTNSIEVLRQHPVPEDKFKILALHGDPQIFSDYAPGLISVNADLLRDCMIYMFKQHPQTRKGLSERNPHDICPPDPFMAFDPIHIQFLCQQGVCPANTHGYGRAIELMKLREVIHANH